MSDSMVANYVEHLKFLIQKSREYTYVGGSGCDNVWELEMLGFGEYSKEWMVSIDLSNALDFILELEFGCERGECRRIVNYEEISRRLLNFDFEGSADRFGVLFFESEIMSKAFAEILDTICQDINYMNCSQDEKMAQLVFVFYSRILNMASRIKDYVATLLQSSNRGLVVYRSKSFSKSILTSDIEYNEDLILRLPGHSSYSCRICSFKRYEWAREVMANEISRDVEYRIG